MNNAEQILYTGLAAQRNLTLEQWFHSLAKEKLQHLERTDLPAYNRLLADLGREVLKQGGNLDIDKSSPKLSNHHHPQPNRQPPKRTKKKCSECETFKGFRAFDGDSKICRKCLEKSSSKKVISVPTLVSSKPSDTTDNSVPSVSEPPTMNVCEICGIRKFVNDFPNPDAERCNECLGLTQPTR